MRIYINNQPFEAVLYDDDTSILQRYALQQSGYIPEYLRIVDQDFQIQEDLKLDVQDILSKISLIISSGSASKTSTLGSDA